MFAAVGLRCAWNRYLASSVEGKLHVNDQCQLPWCICPVHCGRCPHSYHWILWLLWSYHGEPVHASNGQTATTELFQLLMPAHMFLRSPSSSNINLLTILFARTSLAARSFSVTSHKIWNSLPPALHSCNCFNTFHRHLKTHYFQQGLSSPSLCLRFGIC